MWKTTKELEQALVEVQKDKCRIQQLQEELLDQLDEQQEENTRTKQKLEQVQKELMESNKMIKTLNREMMAKEDETMEMFLAIEKLQQELEHVASEIDDRDRTIVTKNAYLHALQVRLNLTTNRTCSNVQELMNTLDNERSSDV